MIPRWSQSISMKGNKFMGKYKEEHPIDDEPGKTVIFNIPLDESGNVPDVGPMNLIQWFSRKHGYAPTINFISYEAQDALTKAMIERMPASVDIAEFMKAATSKQTTFDDELPLEQSGEKPDWPDFMLESDVVEFPTVHADHPDADLDGHEPRHEVDAETADWNRFKPEAMLGKCVTPNQCYTTKQVARKLGIKPNDVHNVCRKPNMAKALGRQQFETGHKCYYLKSAVNAFIDGRQKNGLVLSH